MKQGERRKLAISIGTNCRSTWQSNNNSPMTFCFLIACWAKSASSKNLWGRSLNEIVCQIFLDQVNDVCECTIRALCNCSNHTKTSQKYAELVLKLSETLRVMIKKELCYVFPLLLTVNLDES